MSDVREGDVSRAPESVVVEGMVHQCDTGRGYLLEGLDEAMLTQTGQTVRVTIMPIKEKP